MPYAHLGRLQSKYQPAFAQGFRQVGDLISNLALLKIQQGFREKEAAIGREHQESMMRTQQQLIAGREQRARQGAAPPVVRSEAGLLQWDAKTRTYRMMPGTETTPATTEAEKQRLMKERQIAVEQEKKKGTNQLDIWRITPDGRTVQLKIDKKEAGRYMTATDNQGRHIWTQGTPSKLPKQQVPLNKDQIFKRLRDIQAQKLKTEATKGVDPLTMFLIKDNPQAQDAYRKGDTTAALAEFDRQIEYYNSLLDEPLPAGLTEEHIEQYKTNYGYSREKTISLYKASKGL